MIKTILFDLDGTLLNTLEDLQCAVNAALHAHGLPIRTLSEIQQFVGNGVHKLMQRALPPDSSKALLEQCLKVFYTYYDKHMMVHTVPYPGMLPLVAALHESGRALAVLSNKYDAAAKRLVTHYFEDCFSVVLGERVGVPRKPDPFAVREILELLDTAPEQALYVGDSMVDMQTAHNAGVFSVGVTWGFCDSMEQSGADLLIRSPTDLLYHIQKDGTYGHTN